MGNCSQEGATQSHMEQIPDTELEKIAMSTSSLYLQDKIIRGTKNLGVGRYTPMQFFSLHAILKNVMHINPYFTEFFHVLMHYVLHITGN